jgi:hypothetical protein
MLSNEIQNSRKLMMSKLNTNIKLNLRSFKYEDVKNLNKNKIRKISHIIIPKKYPF